MLLIKKDVFRGERCFIIGSGPSLKDVDWSLLENEVTIAVNESYKAMPFEPTIICCGEYKLWPHVKEAYARMKSSIVTTTGLDGSCGSDYSGTNLLARIPLDKTKSVMEHGFVWNIGAAPVRKGYNVLSETVLPFVCWAGFERAYLLGFDHKPNGYAYPDAPPTATGQAIDPHVFPTHRLIAGMSLPTKIFNATPGSALDAYGRTTLRDIFFPGHAALSDYQVVSYYTLNGNYKKLAERMKASVEKHAPGLAVEIFERQRLADSYKIEPSQIPMAWVLECAQCAHFCLSMWERFRDKHIIYLDADAEMVKYPALFVDPEFRGFDIGAPILNNQFYTNQLSSNTLVFRRTGAARRILQAWYTETLRRIKRMTAGEYQPPYAEAWDQQILQDVLEGIPHQLYKLPWEYAKTSIPPSGVELMPGVNPEDVVIVQHQESRNARRDLRQALSNAVSAVKRKTRRKK